MAIEIFHKENGSTEQWLIVNDDGSVTYIEENSGWRLLKRGPERKEEKISAQEAKKRWPMYADELEAALRKILNND